MELVRVCKGNKWGFVDENNKEVIPFIYDYVYPFNHDNYTYADLNGFEGVIDRTGKILIPFIYNGVYDFKNGFARVKLNDERFWVNKNGTIKIKEIRLS